MRGTKKLARFGNFCKFRKKNSETLILLLSFGSILFFANLLLYIKKHNNNTVVNPFNLKKYLSMHGFNDTITNK